MIISPVPEINPIEVLTWIIVAFVTKNPLPSWNIISFGTFPK